MSNADPEEVVTATSDGVSVEKSFEPDDFPVPAIAFVIRADRDEAVSLRLVDTVPSHVPPEDIGFHPKYGAEFWGVEGDTIVFEREFEPGEEYTTVYGLRGGDSDDVEQFMSEPTIEEVEPPLDDADAGQTVRDVIGDDEGDGTENGDDDIASAVDDVDTDVEAETDADDGAATDETSTDAATPDIGAAEDASMDLPDPETAAGATTAGGAAAATDAESLVTALADEIRSGEVDDDAVDELRDALGVDAQSGSDEARIEHLQSEVADLQAYTDALEEFLDENGDAQQLVADVRADYESIEGRLDDVESTADSAVETAEQVDDQLDARFEELEIRVNEGLNDAEARVDEALAELDDVEETIEEQIETELEELWSAVDDAAQEAEDVAGELRAFREEIDEDAGERVDELEREVQELSEELEDVAEMRDRLASALGGLAPQDDGGDGESGDGDDEE